MTAARVKRNRHSHSEDPNGVHAGNGASEGPNWVRVGNGASERRVGKNVGSANHRRRFNRSNVRSALAGLGVLSNVALLGLLVVASIANLYAFYEALHFGFELKFGPIYTLGGFLTHHLVDAAVRLSAILGLCWFFLVLKKQKNWLDWAGVVFLSAIPFIGTPGLVSNTPWVLAILFWYVFQSFQFAGIFDTDKSVITLIAWSLYLVEFLIQCAANPISGLPADDFFYKLHLGTLQGSEIYWGVVFLNIFCMMGVEWSWRFYLQVNGKLGE